MSAFSRIFTSGKDSLKGPEFDRVRFIQQLGCDPDDVQINRLVDNLVLDVKALHSAAAQNRVKVTP